MCLYAESVLIYESDSILCWEILLYRSDFRKKKKHLKLSWLLRKHSRKSFNALFETLDICAQNYLANGDKYLIY